MSRVSFVAASVAVVLMGTSVARAQAPSSLARAASSPPQLGTALVIGPPGALCPELVTQFRGVGGPLGDLRDRCTELVQNSRIPALETEVQSGLEQMAGVQGDILGTAKAKSAVQFANITARLASLRLGGAGIGLGGLALDAPEPLPGPRLASLAGKEVAQAVPSGRPSADPKWGAFLTGSLTTGDVDATSREAGFDFDGGGVTGGVDYRVTPNLIFGVALGYGVTSADFSNDGGTVDVDDVSVSLYGTYYATDAFYVDGIASIGWSSYDLERTIRYSIPTVPSVGTGITTVNQTATADPDGFGFGIGAAAGYDFRWGALTAGPIGRLNYFRSEVDGYREQITGTDPGYGLALDVDDQTVESLVTGLGAQMSYAISTAVGVIVPQVRFEWVHEFLNDARPYTSRFINDPTPSAATTIRWKTDDPDRDFFNVGVGVAATFARGIGAFVYYEALLGYQNVTQHRIAAGLRVPF